MYIIFLICLAGVFLGFANPILHIPPLIFLFPFALIWTAHKCKSPGQVFKYSWLFSSLAYSFSLYWIAFPVHYFAYLPWIIAGTCPLLLGFYLGLYPAIFSIFIYRVKTRLSWFWIGLLAGSLWTTLEYIRASLLTGFPWLIPAQAFSPWPWAIQGVGIIGAFGFSGIITTCAIWFFFALKGKKALALAPALAILLLLAVYGLNQTSKPATDTNSIAVSIIQGNIDQNQKWEPEYQNSTINKYLELSQAEISENSPELIVWPETAVPFYLQENNEYKERIQRFVSKNKTLLLTGSPGYILVDSTQYQLFNRAYLFSSSGKITDTYEKEKLVPFGEYVPLKQFLPFMDKLVSGVGDFMPGQKIKPLRNDGLALGTLICYEAIFPGLVHKRIIDGANVLVNISNDAWFGPTSAPRQHLHQAILRAVEQNRFLIRSTNTGISAFIGPQGKIMKQSSCFQEQTLHLSKVSLSNKKTLYCRYYLLVKSIFFILAGIFALLALFLPQKALRD